MTVGLSTVLPFETPKSSFTTKVGTRKYRLCVSYGFEPRTFWFSMNQISHCSSAAKCFDLIYYLYPPLVYNSETIMKREPRVYRYKLCITKVFHSNLDSNKYRRDWSGICTMIFLQLNILTFGCGKMSRLFIQSLTI